MKRSYRGASIGVAMTLLLGMFALLSLGCGTIDANGFLGLETCDILNCDGLFFGNLADDHDNMAGMDGMDDAGAHDDEGDDHMDSVDDHLDDDDVEEGGHDDVSQSDGASGQAKDSLGPAGEGDPALRSLRPV